ncbi:MAG: hypothetical protein DSY34_03120 [Desulfurobacterium sp.]|nr:MAG: hypothetical protein DSY34_03120 [Desulfurobacterium sp.]
MSIPLSGGFSKKACKKEGTTPNQKVSELVLQCKNKKTWNREVINNGTYRDLAGYSGTRNIRI